jgi:hypothetical protein
MLEGGVAVASVTVEGIRLQTPRNPLGVRSRNTHPKDESVTSGGFTSAPPPQVKLHIRKVDIMFTRL